MPRLEAIRILLAFTVSQSVKLFQIDVKSAFLNEYIKEEVYVEQPPGFEDHKHPDHVFKLTKALYGLKHGMNVLALSCYRITSREVKWTPLCLSKILTLI